LSVNWGADHESYCRSLSLSCQVCLDHPHHVYTTISMDDDEGADPIIISRIYLYVILRESVFRTPYRAGMQTRTISDLLLNFFGGNQMMK
jgi:hypothetical protein